MAIKKTNEQYVEELKEKNPDIEAVEQYINAKTKKLQETDRTLELRLKQLDTEHNAISSEKDAVSKVIEKAVESGFKTFG